MDPMFLAIYAATHRATAGTGRVSHVECHVLRSVHLVKDISHAGQHPDHRTLPQIHWSHIRCLIPRQYPHMLTTSSSWLVRRERLKKSFMVSRPGATALGGTFVVCLGLENTAPPPLVRHELQQTGKVAPVSLALRKGMGTG